MHGSSASRCHLDDRTQPRPHLLEGLGDAHEYAAGAIVGVCAAGRLDAGVGVGDSEVDPVGCRDQPDLPIPVIAAWNAIGQEFFDPVGSRVDGALARTF
jgi:hypothetical protein